MRHSQNSHPFCRENSISQRVLCEMALSYIHFAGKKHFAVKTQFRRACSAKPQSTSVKLNGLFDAPSLPLRKTDETTTVRESALHIDPSAKMEDIFDDGFRNMHSRVDITADLTMKAVIRIVVRDYFPKLSDRQKELFRTGPFGQFLDIQGANGDPLLVNTMMLHEVRSHALENEGRFGFNVQGISLQYGSMEFCLITGLKFAPFTNLIDGTKNPKNSKLRSRLFKDETDQTLRLSHLEEFIVGKRFSKVPDEDTVMIMQMFFLLRGMLGRELKSCIPPLILELVDNHCNWNKFSWGSFLWSYTVHFAEMPLRNAPISQSILCHFYVRMSGASFAEGQSISQRC
ncbi:hypothetical protein LXL04_013632 [Taraxacum kok-saghyz]